MELIYYFSAEQQFNAWVVSDLVKQLFNKWNPEETSTQPLTLFAEQHFHISIDYLFSIIINIGDIESIEQDPQDLLSSYLNILFPFVTRDMMKASMQNANEYLLKERDADVYKLFASLPPFLSVSLQKK
ncbi:YfmB family protein [Bacillus sp. NPDC093026]|uniref:YfmB family protein n=1 Tax=Bacillus sp. NPDC093026 TaxID=3363948 RepID=UPI00381B59EE